MRQPSLNLILAIFIAMPVLALPAEAFAQGLLPQGFSPQQSPGQRYSDSEIAAPGLAAESLASPVTTATSVPAQPIGSPLGALSDNSANETGSIEFSDLLSREAEKLSSSEGVGSSVKIALLLATLSLAPAIILMTTSYVRIVVVLSLLRQAFGAQQLPPNQVITALSLFLTLVVMAPVWNQVKREAIDPYASSAEAGEEVSWSEAWQRGIHPVKAFMSRQIELAGNGDSVALFYKYSRDPARSQNLPSTYDEVPINVLLPAFMISELKVAFLLGFQIYLPFLVLDLIVSTVTVSMGMLMLPPTMVSFPLKLILFVMVDGWNLVVGMLLQSFGPFT